MILVEVFDREDGILEYRRIATSYMDADAWIQDFFGRRPNTTILPSDGRNGVDGYITNSKYNLYYTHTNISLV